ncbi:preprotein translocase subunit SecG [Streptococcus azizii]|uniref:Protein-export membrane protein SecG n=1 Tax=Streptococcus azizii TaxID=1579424 RepID=A0AB36JLK1_9STRE|nr:MULTISPECIES: preprotein translocase subunit SecG [Streptococcus]MBF0776951.1 preprotein translocase subunit SecG [Streptococcus sp. 19428wD3_AN2]ONK25488.1 preprotein translocase subunit SecG [Streptococcus azizii]ONK25756.1 preprotein translocase subunit SecG [Streptococcus azizii]ONK26101.1 preprotein translocase subunit SecG [Streptococcus azizii]TFU82049.1 preprotein translocase subunit SecG [Streptococcus sp. AN2]
MYNLLLTILLILSAIIIIAIFMQPAKNQSSNVFDASSGALFERTKARGFEAVMQRLTAILVFCWMLTALALVIISSK